MKTALRYFAVVGGAIVSILLFLLASASDNSGFFDRYYGWLLGLNAAVAAALLLLVVVSLFRLYSRYKAGKFGSKLMTRLVLLFAAIGVLPGLVIFLVSVQFVSHSIESWFNVPVEEALESGINLSRAGLDRAVSELSVTAGRTAQELADQPFGSERAILATLVKNEAGMQNAIIIDAEGGLVVSARASRSGNLSADLPTRDMMAKVKKDALYGAPEGGNELHSDLVSAPVTPEPVNQLRLRVVIPVPDHVQPNGTHLAPRYLQLIQLAPSQLAADGETIRRAYADYKERFDARGGLRKMYVVTLTLTLLLAVFGAIAAAFLIASDLAQPLLLLAEGTRAVAEGDLSPRPIVATSDELGTLTQSFNTMTRQLSDARSAVERNRSALQNAKAHLESVLANMSAGVMVLDHEFHLISCNDSVERILQQAGVTMIGQKLDEIEGLQEFGAAIVAAFAAQNAQSAAGRNLARLHWQRQIEVPRRNASSVEDNDLTLLTRGSRLPVEGGSGYLVVFDDISDVISAQRSIAWGEVARRLAHEIKNPLTPIQLSAERMQMKLEDKLMPADVELLNKGTATIVNQVAAMKRMVDDFRDYAKTPPAVLESLDLNALVDEILHLYISGEGNDIIHPQLAPGLPLVMGDPTQLRQVIHNLLQNAQDAMAELPDGAPQARIDVITEAIHYQGADGSSRTAVRLAISDNGPGFAPKILARAFEPYVTSKARGTGLGLAMVKKIIEEHGGRIDIQNHVDRSGASVLILLLKLAPASQNS
ncbi:MULTISPECIES: ATP-binding protein [unclassified Duganella]|uniref:sensor histidine kinase n=1 Tax=unclassified Duganella TaxID=2636909 RepID=UPI00088CEC71|nr:MULTISPECIES: ATP-binding protein [unclassified Duganella]SDG72365.1 Signal transduction histidine kinase involved in nitrogen fixation and metabolism regulation [Duganella sp. OV458]SDJ98425.1 Signal transduction histidine kinase involved in nitrogen fixation and metabolism regulation [Duganella sp. OV510]